jgi:hypothetical protein
MVIKKQGQSDQQLISQFFKEVNASGIKEEAKRLMYHEDNQEKRKRKLAIRTRERKLHY